MNSDITRRDLGRFVAERRRAVGLTQRDLAARLHVTESAVSKWERGLSYPDITMVQTLAAELRVTGQELLGASEDHEARAAQRDARVYRNWRAALLWTTGIAYALTILTCFIVNISVSHTLSWFWIVAAAVALACSLTTLPLLRIPHRGWLALGASLLSLTALLLIVRAQFAPGPWVWIVLAAVAFAAILVFAPILLGIAPLPAGLAQHRTVLSLAIDTVALALFLGVIALATGLPGTWLTMMLPLAAIGVIPVWTIALVIRYLPGTGLWAAAVVTAVLAVCTPAIDWAVARVVGDRFVWNPDLADWQTSTMESNIQLLVVIGLGLLALGFAVAALIVTKRRDSALAPRGKAAID